MNSLPVNDDENDDDIISVVIGGETEEGEMSL